MTRSSNNPATQTPDVALAAVLNEIKRAEARLFDVSTALDAEQERDLVEELADIRLFLRRAVLRAQQVAR